MIGLQPRRVVESVLVPYEEELYEDVPSMVAFLLNQVVDLVVIVAILWIIFASGDPLVIRVGSFMIVGLCSWLMVRAYVRLHTRYVLTNYRAIRLSGLVRRDVEWMTWSKVTDVTIRRSLVDRVFGTATVKIMSANEASGFKAMTDLSHPHEFVGWVTDLVAAKHGPVPAAPA